MAKYKSTVPSENRAEVWGIESLLQMFVVDQPGYILDMEPGQPAHNGEGETTKYEVKRDGETAMTVTIRRNFASPTDTIDISVELKDGEAEKVLYEDVTGLLNRLKN